MDTYDSNFKVCIKCWTYNHAPYIIDALNGFVIQKTSFPYVCIIVDDASSDGEPNVIRNYLSKHFDLVDNSVVRNEETNDYVLSFARHRTNKNCFFAIYFLKYNHHGKKNKSVYFENWVKSIQYHAICEGDDYWTDPLKLQKQVSFLDSHNEFSICFHSVKLLFHEEGRYSIDNAKDVASETCISDLAEGNYIHTLSVVFRYNPLVYNELNRIGKVPASDYVLHMLNAKYGKIKKITDCMGVYRLNESSVWGLKKEVDRLPLWNEMLIKMMPFFDETTQEILHQQYLQNCLELYRLGEQRVYSSKAYRIGSFLIHPFKLFHSNK